MTTPRHAQAGFTLIEVLMAVALIGILVTALSVGLTGMVSSPEAQEELMAYAHAARGKMEEVIASGFDNIPLSSPPGTSEPTLSDKVTIQGQLIDRTVVVDLSIHLSRDSYWFGLSETRLPLPRPGQFTHL